ncbi:MAG: hypothetical protein COB35_09175 [Gammaproteobacteria bacterium]|nr:MAG: hypothetical protein COB35_09175 [Gammaproteobacteria bacterium]
MTAQLNKIAKLLILVAFTFILQACGGSSNNTPKFSISVDTTNIGLSNKIFTKSTTTITVKINFKGDGLLVGFAPNAQPASWLNYRTGEVTATSATLFIDVVSAQFLPSDLYETTLRLSTGDVTKNELVHQDINVSLLIWQLLSFGETFGADTIASQTFEFNNADQQWTLSSDVDWLNLSTTFDSQTNRSTVTITPDLTKLSQAGLNQGNLVFKGKTGNTNFPVELGLDNIYLYADKTNVAFTSTTNINATKTTITIGSNNPKGFDWQAQTEANWLTLTPIEGTNQLQISADIALAPNTEFNQASIVISPKINPANPDAVSPIINETIKVSLYKNDIIIKTQTISDITANNNAVVNAPLKPYTYIGVNNELRIYQQYTGELISSTIIAPENSLLEQFVIHPNGELLIAKADETVIDLNNLDADGNPIETIVTHRYKINLIDLSFSEITDANIQFEPVKFIRFAGRYFVVTQILEYADENLQRLALDNANAFFARGIQTAAVAQSLFAFDPASGNLKRFTATVNDFTTTKITTTKTHEYRPENLATNDTIVNFVVSSDEQNIYAISPTSEWLSFDGTTFTDNGLLATNTDIVTLALSLSDNNRPHYLRFDPANPAQGFIINVYDQQKVLSATLTLGNNQPSSIAMSADNKRLVLNESTANNIEFVNLQQFDTSTNQLNFNTTLGNSNASIAAQVITLAGVDANWQASTNVPWLVLAQDNSGEQPSLTVSVDSSNITTWGLLTGTITIYDPASGTNTIITVNLAIDEVRLSSNYPALAFNSAATQQTLTHTIDVLINRETSITWQATTAADWLTLSADNTNNRLTISADASKVSNGLTYATITLSSVTNGAAVSGTIKVSINKAAADASEVTISNAATNTDGVVLDPLRPYIYLAIGDSIKVYNIISAALEATIASPLTGINLTNLVIFPDGSKLLASNTETVTDDQGVETTTVHHYQVDLATQSITEIDNANVTIEFRPIDVQMIDGKAVVITQTLEFADTNLVRQTWDQDNAYFAGKIAAPASKDSFMVVKNSASSLEQYQLTFNVFADQTITAKLSNSYVNTAFSNAISALALSNNGDNIYTINSATEHSIFDGTSFTDKGLLDNTAGVSAFNVTTDSEDNSYFYRFDPAQGFVLTKYDSAQQVISTQVLSSGSVTNYLAPDYQRVLNFDAGTATFTLLSMQ